MKQEHYDSFAKNLGSFFDGNQSAVELCMMLIKVADVWDDIVDGDKPSYDDVNKAFMICLFSLDENQFYQVHKASLKPIILSITLKWMDANTLESKGEDLEKCYMLRAGLYDLFAHCAFLISGYDYYQKIGPIIRKFYGETYEEFKESLECQIQSQQ